MLRDDSVAHLTKSKTSRTTSSLRRGSSFDDVAALRALHGAARRHAAFVARTAARRRAREAAFGGNSSNETEWKTNDDGAPLSTLSPALRTTLHLLIGGLSKADLLYLLRINDAALRKRFQALRAHAPLARPTPAPATTTSGPMRRTQIGMLPALTSGQRRAFATTDPDGHGIVSVDSLTPGSVAATSSSKAKGRTC